MTIQTLAFRNFRATSRLLPLVLAAACGSSTKDAPVLPDGGTTLDAPLPNLDSSGKDLKPASDTVANIEAGIPGQEGYLLKMDSIQGVSYNPPNPTIFTMTQPSRITRVMTYHYGATIGTKAVTLSFKDTTSGATFGPYPQVGYKSFNGTLGATKADPGNVAGPPDNYWMAYPNKVIPAGTYQVIDSDPATWAHTTDQGKRGLTFVYGYPDGSPKVITCPFAGTLSPAPGLTGSDFELQGTSLSDPVAIPATGALKTDTQSLRAGFLFASPKEGSPTAAKLFPDTGLYMTPTAGTYHVVKTGATWSVATTGSAAMDATTTVLSFLLLHPMAANLDPAIARQQLGWLVDQVNAGASPIATAATAYDLALSAATDPFADVAFQTALTAALNLMADGMPEFTSTSPAISATTFHADNAPYFIHSANALVSSLTEEGVSTTAVTLKPETKSGTALDYYFHVKEIADSAMTEELDTPAFVTPNILQSLPTTRTITSGFVASSSYWKYLDLAGFVLQETTNLIAGVTPFKPGDSVDFPATKFYDVRFFSGAIGVGPSYIQYEAIEKNFAPETAAAFKHNVATAVVETISLIPGSELLLESETASKVLEAAILQTTTELSALLNSKGAAKLEGSDVYNLMYNVCKTAVDTFIVEATEEAQKSKLKQLFKWLKVGGEKAVKFVMSVPGKVAKGGSLANRAFRLIRPESIAEEHLVAVGYSNVPKITLLSPAQAAVGDTLTITGKYLGKTGDPVQVKFSGANTIAATRLSTTQITTQVPTGATTGNVVVMVNSVASNALPFTLAAATATDGACGKTFSGKGAASKKISVGTKSGSMLFQAEAGDSECLALHKYVVTYEGKVLFTADCTCNASNLVPFTFGAAAFVTLDVSVCAGSDSSWGWSFYAGCP